MKCHTKGCPNNAVLTVNDYPRCGECADRFEDKNLEFCVFTNSDYECYNCTEECVYALH